MGNGSPIIAHCQVGVPEQRERRVSARSDGSHADPIHAGPPVAGGPDARTLSA